MTGRWDKTYRRNYEQYCPRPRLLPNRRTPSPVLSIKQGLKYDSPESARDIPTFIAFHKLNVDEIAEPLSNFCKCIRSASASLGCWLIVAAETCNQFFYRKLNPDARPVECPDDPYRLVSGADCRLMVTTARGGEPFGGREVQWRRAVHLSARAHRFYSPVDGTIGPTTDIAGEYYTVNPQAIRSALDVYGENVRKIVPIDSPQFGRVACVCIGAMMVGSIHMTVEEGQQVKRGQEFGYLAFGGSTIVVLFEKGVVQRDEDLLINSRACLETLVRVGMGIGHGKRKPNTDGGGAQ
ncbi:hypothetical protein FKP32DRAFT_1671210 [Trametes sanguinea]|nr:hypothetical protein FKP32DRAFT_1671210 [Trametes sanguinea]